MTKLNIPVRVQRSRAAGSRQPESTRYCGRGTRWGNPHRIGSIDPATMRELTRDDVLLFHDVKIGAMITEMGEPLFIEFFLLPLTKYKHLSCFCSLDDKCHVDQWIEYIVRFRKEIKEFTNGRKA